MELERSHTFFRSFDTVADTILFREETAESIVPDACPDIARIAAVDGSVFLTGKHTYEGRGEITGEVRVSVLYLAEQDQTLRHMEVTLPFTCVLEQAGITSSAAVTAIPRLRSVDARTLNPRKILARAEVAVETRVHVPREHQILSALSCDGSAGIQQQTAQEAAFLTVAVEEKEFPFSDSLKLSGAPCQELFSVRALPVCSEAKIIGSKLILKGEVKLQALYRSGDGPETAQFDLPFSQIMEVTEAGEESDVTAVVTPRSLTCLPAGEGGDHLEVSLQLLAQAAVQEERTLTVLRDVYSTVFETAVTAESLSLKRLVDRSEVPVTFREMLPCENRVRRVVDCRIMPGQTEAASENGSVRLTAPATVTVFCEGEEGDFFQLSGLFPVSCQMEQPQEGAVSGVCECVGEAYAAPTAGGVEARASLRFRCLCISDRQAAIVSDVTCSEDRPCSGEVPSLILRPVRAGERLWDIAKSCRTTVSDIVKVNSLSEEDALCGQMLLIPRHR